MSNSSLSSFGNLNGNGTPSSRGILNGNSKISVNPFKNRVQSDKQLNDVSRNILPVKKNNQQSQELGTLLKRLDLDGIPEEVENTSNNKGKDLNDAYINSNSQASINNSPNSPVSDAMLKRLSSF